MILIAITGATGNTGRPAAETLLAKVEEVRVIGRDAKKLDPFVQKGAEAFVGNVEDAASMKKAFEGATAAYLAVPGMHGEGLRAYQERVTDAYAAAIAEARVPYAITLSSLGAQYPEKTGPIVGLHNMEEKLNRIKGLNVLHLRPAQFMENLFMSMAPLRSVGVLPGGSPGDAPQPWIATKDIGAYAAERLSARNFSGSSTQELVGPRDYTLKEVAAIIGKAIGKPSLGYMQVPFMMLEPALVQMGLPKSTAALLIEMWKAMNDGLLTPRDTRSAKIKTGTTLESFALESFAPTFQSKTASS
jgi:uncharacterized protein YbjT (DUF2867 family)